MEVVNHYFKALFVLLKEEEEEEGENLHSSQTRGVFLFLNLTITSTRHTSRLAPFPHHTHFFKETVSICNLGQILIILYSLLHTL